MSGRQTGPTFKAPQAGGATSLPAIAAGLHEAGIDISDTRIWSVLTTAPGATADATDTRPRHAGMAADPFWYNVLESARAIVFDARAIVFEGCARLLWSRYRRRGAKRHAMPAAVLR